MNVGALRIYSMHIDFGHNGYKDRESCVLLSTSAMGRRVS